MKALSTSRHAKPSGAKSASRSPAAKTQTAAESAPNPHTSPPIRWWSAPPAAKRQQHSSMA